MKHILVVMMFSLLSQNATVHAQEFSWEMFAPATTGMGQPCTKQNLTFCRNESSCLGQGAYWYNNKCNANVSCSEIAKCYSGSVTDNCPGYNVTGTIGVNVSSNCTFSTVSIFGVKTSGTITGRRNNTYTGSGQTDANGCGPFTITCTDHSTSISCSYKYNNGRVGSISNGYSAQCIPANKFLTQSLSGSWAFVFQIISNWTYNYYLNGNDISEYPVGSGEYSIYGVGDYNNLVVAGYHPRDNFYSLLDPGTNIDLFYVFTYTSTNRVSGCYYQINKSTGAWSQCYPMNGNRYSTSYALRTSGLKDKEMCSEDDLLQINEVESNQTYRYLNTSPVEPAIAERYKSLKNMLESTSK